MAAPPTRSGPTAPRSEDEVRNSPDPLYDPAFLIFVYSGWAAATAFVGQRAGLLVLVFGTIMHSVVALRQRQEPEDRPFVHDFSVILLFCSAAIAAGALLLG